MSTPKTAHSVQEKWEDDANGRSYCVASIHQKNGKAHGETVFRWLNGGIKTEADFEEDLLEGRLIEYHEGIGRKKYEGTYQQNYRVSLHVDYDAKGQISRILEYANTIEEVVANPLPLKKTYLEKGKEVLILTYAKDGTVTAQNIIQP